MKNLLNIFVVLVIVFVTAYTANSQITITAQPDSCYGKDAHVVYITSIPNSIYDNYGSINEFVPLTWTYSGHIGYVGAFIDFIDLQSIPQGATISSATLYLYGPSYSNTAPQGNSGDNKCWVQRVTASWDEFTINWANQPSTTTTNESSLPTSTSQWGV